jgi:hypothetical protein
LSGDAPAREAKQVEIDRAQRAEEITQKILAVWAGDDETIGACEVRLWIHAGLKPAFSGQLDRLYSKNNFTEHLIIDYKTLYGDHLDAADNWQIKAQAALVFEAYPMAEYITAAIVQPEANKQPDVACFIRDDLIRFRGQLAMDLNNAHDANPHFKAGKWCQYCKALAICPVQKLELAKVESVTINSDAWAVMPAEDKVRLFDACERADDFIKAVKKRIKDEVIAGNDFGGQFRLRPGRKTQEITDVAGAFQRLSGDLTVIDFNKACSASRPGLVDAMRAAKQITKKEAEASIETLLEGLIEVKQSAPSLERVTP